MKTCGCHRRITHLNPKASGAKEVPTMKSLKLILTLASLLAFVSTACAQGTVFTWQGRLTDAGQPANGRYDALSVALPSLFP